MATTRTREQDTPIAADGQINDLDYLKSEQKRINDAIKAARANQPSVTPLDKVIAKQASQLNKWLPETLASRTRARIRAGQDRETALRQVIAFYVTKVNELLDAEPEAEGDTPRDPA